MANEALFWSLLRERKFTYLTRCDRQGRRTIKSYKICNQRAEGPEILILGLDVVKDRLPMELPGHCELFPL